MHCYRLALMTLLLGAGAARAQGPPPPAAADVAPTATPDTRLSWHGVTLYGLIDLGVQYQTHGAPANDYLPYTTSPVVQKTSNHSVTAFTSNNLGYSKIGLSGFEPLNPEWAVVFKLETLFNPTSGQLTDSLKSLTQNNGKLPTAQSANQDGSVAGQLFGNAAYIGLSSHHFGTLTFGREYTLLSEEGVRIYDPMQDGRASAHAFSLLGGSGTTAGGGDTENKRLDRIVKYSAQFNWLHLGALYQLGKGSGSADTAIQAQLGASLGKASLDAFYTKKYDAVAASAMNPGQVSGLADLCAANPQHCFSIDNSVAATISDNTAYALMGLYDFGGPKLYAGYEHISYANPRTPLEAGDSIIGGYVLAYVNNSAYVKQRVLQVFWSGIKWPVTKALELTASYYGYRQNSFATGSNEGCTGNQSSGCSGRENAFAALADYRFTRRFDVYFGTFWTGVQDGLANGFTHTSTLTTSFGMRFAF